MENAIIIYPNSREEASLYKQLAKRLNNRIEAKKDSATSKKKILDSLKESIHEMKLHQEGKLDLRTIEDVLDEL